LKKKNSASLLAVALGLAVFASACGDDGGSEATTTTAKPAASTGASTGASAAPTTTGKAKTDYSALKGSIKMDGSSTVAPVMKVAAEDFQDATKKGVTVTVGVSGTGGGFEKFCKGETDISNASRVIKTSTDPAKPAEKQNCEKAGVAYIELQVANDGLSVIHHPKNTWAKCLTVDELKKIWAPEGAVSNWKDVRAGFPDKAIKRFGAGTDSGTFDYFTEAVNGSAGKITKDYNPSEDDNVTITGVAGDEGSVGFLGLSYALENKSKVTLAEIDGGKGCVAPATATVQDGTYAPLGRPLFVYVSKTAFARPEVKGFVNYYFENIDAIVKDALFVPLNATQLAKATDAVKAAG
jgi:phosphate transport system substrate-binding protein